MIEHAAWRLWLHSRRPARRTPLPPTHSNKLLPSLPSLGEKKGHSEGALSKNNWRLVLVHSCFFHPRRAMSSSRGAKLGLSVRKRLFAVFMNPHTPFEHYCIQSHMRAHTRTPMWPTTGSIHYHTTRAAVDGNQMCKNKCLAFPRRDSFILSFQFIHKLYRRFLMYDVNHKQMSLTDGGTFF